jgi:hypothetical protein
MNTNDTQQLSMIASSKELQEVWRDLEGMDKNSVYQLLSKVRISANAVYRFELVVTDLTTLGGQPHA